MWLRPLFGYKSPFCGVNSAILWRKGGHFWGYLRVFTVLQQRNVVQNLGEGDRNYRCYKSYRWDRLRLPIIPIALITLIQKKEVA